MKWDSNPKLHLGIHIEKDFDKTFVKLTKYNDANVSGIIVLNA